MLKLAIAHTIAIKLKENVTMYSTIRISYLPVCNSLLSQWRSRLKAFQRGIACCIACWLNGNPNLQKIKSFFFEDWEFFFYKMWKKVPKFHWESGRILAPENKKKKSLTANPYASGDNVAVTDDKPHLDHKCKTAILLDILLLPFTLQQNS